MRSRWGRVENGRDAWPQWLSEPRRGGGYLHFPPPSLTLSPSLSLSSALPWPSRFSLRWVSLIMCSFSASLSYSILFSRDRQFPRDRQWYRQEDRHEDWHDKTWTDLNTTWCHRVIEIRFWRMPYPLTDVLPSIRIISSLSSFFLSLSLEIGEWVEAFAKQRN